MVHQEPISVNCRNTICRNARRAFGSDYEIWVPNLVRAARADSSVVPDRRSAAIPIHWRRHSAQLRVALS